jgi:hypothetical protein
VLVDQIDDLAEARADEHHVGRGKRERQPLRGLGVVGLVRFKRVVAKLRPGETDALARIGPKLDERAKSKGSCVNY